MELLIIIVLIAAVLIWSSNNDSKKKAAMAIELRDTYDAALRSGNKTEALIAGRKYYSFLRKGKGLTIYDEQALTNDLSTMQ